jgi:type II secretory pathway pseudopilin PulG
MPHGEPKAVEKKRPLTPGHRFSRADGGFTMVEAIVSALLLTICLSAVVIVVRIGTQLQTSDNNHRQARGILRSTLEDEFDFRQYGTIPDSTTSVNIVDIDPRDGNVLQGHLSKIASSDSITLPTGTKIPVKAVTLVINWTEEGGDRDTVVRTLTMDKILAEVQ